MGKSFLVADFYHWISGGILHDGFETVVKKGDRPCFKFFSKLAKNKLDFLCLLISIAGGVVLLIGFTTNGGIYKAIGKAFLKNAVVGFYMIIIGWVVAIVGYFSK